MAESKPKWRADHVRVTFFGIGNWSVDPTELVSAFPSMVVDAVSERPAISEKTASAILEPTKRIEFKRSFNRLDWIVQPRIDIEPESLPPLLDDAEAELTRLVEAAADWVAGKSVQVSRIAMGFGGLLEVEDVLSSYRKIVQLVPLIKIDPAHHRDLQFRINSPIVSRVVPELPINVLATWTSAMINMGTFNPAQPAEQVLTSSSRHFVQCASDVNTDAHRNTPLPWESLPSLARELMVTTVGILSNGSR